MASHWDKASKVTLPRARQLFFSQVKLRAASGGIQTCNVLCTRQTHYQLSRLGSSAGRAKSVMQGQRPLFPDEQDNSISVLYETLSRFYTCTFVHLYICTVQPYVVRIWLYKVCTDYACYTLWLQLPLKGCRASQPLPHLLLMWQCRGDLRNWSSGMECWPTTLSVSIEVEGEEVLKTVRITT